jgi:hypothetical protein
MIDTQSLVLDNLRFAAKELPVCRSHLKAVSKFARLLKRRNDLQIEETQELIRINDEHATFMQLHFKELGEVMTHPRRAEMASIVEQIGEIKP